MKVYQAKKPIFTEELQKWPDDYDMVAEIEDDVFHTVEHNLDTAYRLTNTIDKPWGSKPARSTSVGDIVEFQHRRYLCCSAGWKEIKKKLGETLANMVLYGDIDEAPWPETWGEDLIKQCETDVEARTRACIAATFLKLANHIKEGGSCTEDDYLIRVYLQQEV